MSGDPRPCKLCGRPIIFRPGPSGSSIPLQRIRTVYAMRADRREARKLETPAALELYVSHFETCPHASRFTRRRAAPTTQP